MNDQVIVMDLTPQNDCWWPIFRCCRPWSTALLDSTDDDDDAGQDHDEYCNGSNDCTFSITPPLKVITTGCKLVSLDAMGGNIDTPTTAGSESSDGEEKYFS